MKSVPESGSLHSIHRFFYNSVVLLSTVLLFPVVILAATANAQTPVLVVQNTGTSITATITATGAGHLLAACGYARGGSGGANNDSFTMTVTGSSDTFTHCTSCKFTSAGVLSLQDCYYILSTSTGTTAVVFTDITESVDQMALGVWEISGCTSCAFDTSNNGQGSTSTAPTGPALTVASTNSAIVTFESNNTSASSTLGINGGNEFTSDGTNNAHNRAAGIAHLFDTTAGSHQPVWSLDISDSVFGSIMSFTKTGGGGTTGTRIIGANVF